MAQKVKIIKRKTTRTHRKKAPTRCKSCGRFK